MSKAVHDEPVVTWQNVGHCGDADVFFGRQQVESFQLHPDSESHRQGPFPALTAQMREKSLRRQDGGGGAGGGRSPSVFGRLQRFAILVAPTDGKQIGRVAVDPEIVIIGISVEVKTKTTGAHFRHRHLEWGDSKQGQRQSRADRQGQW